MDNNNLGLLGYLILIFGISLELSIKIKEENNINLFYEILQLFGYILIFYNLYLKKNEEFNLGHVILFLFYFYSLFLSEENIYFVTLISLLAHFILMKENNKFIRLGQILSVIYYSIKLECYLYESNYIKKIKSVAFALLTLFYINESVYIN